MSKTPSITALVWVTFAKPSGLPTFAHLFADDAPVSLCNRVKRRPVEMPNRPVFCALCLRAARKDPP